MILERFSFFALRCSERRLAQPSPRPRARLRARASSRCNPGISTSSTCVRMRISPPIARFLIDPGPGRDPRRLQKNLNYTRNVSRWVGPDEPAHRRGHGLHPGEHPRRDVQGAGLRNHAAPEPGVLRVSASIADLYVNAPDRFSPWNVKTFHPGRRPGDAAARGARRSQRNAPRARGTHGMHARSAASTWRATFRNRFWFDTLFKRWRLTAIAEFEAGRQSALNS